MADTVTIRYASGTTFNEATGQTETAYVTRLVSKCKVQTRTLQARQEEVGGRTATTVSVELHLPVSAGAVVVGDVCEITAVGSLTDSQLLGRKFRIVAPVAKSYATARRLDVEEVVS